MAPRLFVKGRIEIDLGEEPEGLSPVERPTGLLTPPLADGKMPGEA